MAHKPRLLSDSNQIFSIPLSEYSSTTNLHAHSNDRRERDVANTSWAGNDGRSLLQWFDKIFHNITLMASLGAGFTFTVVLSPLKEVQNSIFTVDTINTIVAVSWLCFTLDLVLVTAFSSYLDFNTKQIIRDVDAKNPVTHCILTAIAFVVQALVLCGFMTASLAVTAFSRIAGWTALGFISFFTLWLLLSIIAGLKSFFDERAERTTDSIPD